MRRGLSSLAAGLALGALSLRAEVLAGRVVFPDDLPPLRPIPVTTQASTCGRGAKPNEALLRGPLGGLANVVVTLPDLVAASSRGAGPGEGDAPAVAPAATASRPRIDQVNCVFQPHVLVVQAGEEFELASSDPVLHNVHAMSERGHYTRFNLALPPGAPAMVRREARPGALVLRCDAGHRWMRAFLYVAPGPVHALTDRAGGFRLEGVPPGTHTLRVWHEVLGRRDFSVEVGAGADTHVEVRARLGAAPRFVLGPAP